MVCLRPRQVFKLQLFDVEKDEKYFTVPKIVVECIKFIEEYENVITSYLYKTIDGKTNYKQRKILEYQVIGTCVN